MSVRSTVVVAIVVAVGIGAGVAVVTHDTESQGPESKIGVADTSSVKDVLSDMNINSTPATVRETESGAEAVVGSSYVKPSNMQEGKLPTPEYPSRWWKQTDTPPGERLRSDFCQKFDGWSNTVVPITEVCINSDGFRDREYDEEKPDDTYRVIALGDAVTFGQGVNNSDTWPNQLEKKLNGSGLVKEVGYDRAQVLNFGFPAWATKEEVILFERKGPKYNPDLVVIQYMDNDNQNRTKVGQLQEKYFEKLESNISDISTRRTIASKTALREEKLQRRAMPLEEEMEIVEKYFDRMDELSEKHGFKVILMFYATEYSERHRDYLDDLVTDKYGWRFMTSDLSDRENYSQEKYLVDDREEVFYLNERGYNATAQDVFDFMKTIPTFLGDS